MRGGARGARGVAGRRAASHGGARGWPAAPRPLPPPPGAGCQSLLPDAGQHRLPSQGEGAEKRGGARSPGKDPRSFPERKSPRPPRGRKPGRAKAECRPRASCRPPRTPPTALRGARNLSAFHDRVPAPETAWHPWPGPRWPLASLALAAGGARPVPVTHFGARAAQRAGAPLGGAGPGPREGGVPQGRDRCPDVRSARGVTQDAQLSPFRREGD